MKTSELVNEILPAILKVKQQLKGVAKTSNNPYFKSKYADLNSHIDAVEDLLQDNGLILFQPVVATDQGNFVSTRISHAVSGQFIESTVKLVGESDMQKVGSAITYGRRYTLGSLLSMKAEDDDGNLASGKEQKKTYATKTNVADTTTASVTPTVQASTSTPVGEPSKYIPKPGRPSFRKPQKAAESVQDEVQEETSNGDDL